MYKQPKAIIFLGAPGSGKGTQAARLSATLEIPAISTGEILRREVQAGTELGRRLQDVLRAGQLVPDEQMNEIVAARVARKDCGGGFILDGFPRTVHQAIYLDRVLRRQSTGKPAVFEFAVSADELIERLRCRRQCPTCGRIFGSLDGSSRIPSLCQNDRTLLVSREDDRPAAIRERLRIYSQNSAELIAYYRGAEFYQIRAALDVAEVTEQLVEALGLVPKAAAVAPAARFAAAPC